MHNTDPKTLTIHPAAAAIPNLPPAQYQALKNSIDRKGILQPLLVDAENRVIDGRHRLQAAVELGLEAVPIASIDGEDAALVACEAAVARRNLTASGRVLVLYVAHPALKQDAKERGHANLKRGAKRPGLSANNPGDSKESSTFAAVADRYGVPPDYFSKLAAIEAQCGGAEEWAGVQRAILDAEASIPALNAGMGGKAATKGKKRSDPQYAVIAPRAAVTLGNSFKAWNRIPQDGRQRVLAEMRVAFRVMPDAVRALAQATILEHWPAHEKAELSALLKRDGTKTGRHS